MSVPVPLRFGRMAEHGVHEDEACHELVAEAVLPPPLSK